MRYYMVRIMLDNGEFFERYTNAENDGDAVRNAFHGCFFGGRNGTAMVFCEQSEIGIKYDFVGQ